MPFQLFKQRERRLAWRVACFILILLAALFVVSCGKNVAQVKPPDVDYYTCTMHPSVRLQHPGDTCPICSMNLVPVFRHEGTNNTPLEQITETNKISHGAEKRDESKPTEFIVTPQRQQQIGVTYASVENQVFTHTMRAVGMVSYDKKRHWDYVARVEGYVKELSVFSRGEPIEKDGPLFTLYSPELLNTQREYVDALKRRDEAKLQGTNSTSDNATRLLESIIQRMRFWNIGNSQIADLEKSRTPSESMVLRSPFKGIIQDLAVDQGKKVMPGDHLIDIVDLSTVWVWVQFYQDELPMLKVGLSVTITSSSYPGEQLTGKVSLIDPFLNDTLRTGRVRIDVDNSDFKLRPDMYVDVDLKMDMGHGLAVPTSAVLPTGQHNIIFVDKGGGKLEPRYIEIGRKFGEYYELKSGLKEKERVVTSANFLIDAEARVQGALKSF